MPLPSGGRRGDPTRAGALLDQAGLLARAPQTKAWISVWRADEALQTGTGGVRVCRASCDAAARALEAVDRRSAGSPIGALVYGVEQQLGGVRAQMLAAAGRADQAEAALAPVLASAATVRQRVITLTQIAAVRVKADDPEGACAALADALDAAGASGYRVGVERIRGVRAGYPGRWTPLPCVAALDERLALT